MNNTAEYKQLNQSSPRHKAMCMAGQAMFGEQWQSELARSLGINSRRIREWASGERPIPDWLLPELKTEIESRIALLARAKDEIININE